MSLDALIEKANQENVKPEPPQEEPSVQADNTDVFGEADLQMQEDTALPEGVFDDALFGSMDMGMSEEPELSEKEKIHIRQMRIAWMHCCSPLWQKVC